jgi:hypothetical protein
MDSRKLQFLKAVIGPDGASALAKAATANPDLEWAIFPRVVMAWLDVVGHAGDYSDELPGAADVKLKLHKSEGVYSGSINIGNALYPLQDVSLYHVAGAVAVALGAEARSAPELRSPHLAKLGKSIDVLVKSRTLRKAIAKQKTQGGAKGAGPGQPAAARPPMQPLGPQAVQAPNTGKNGTAGTKVQLPGTKPKKPTMKVTKSEAGTKCSACGHSQFKKERYNGCFCFSDMAKSVRTTPIDDGYVLEFGSQWDADAIATLAESLGK